MKVDRSQGSIDFDSQRTNARKSFDEDLGSQRDDTDPVLRNSPTDGIVQVHNEDNQTEFDNFSAGYVQTDINALWTVDWTNFIKKSSFRIHFLWISFRKVIF